MSAQVLYLENALTPQNRIIREVEPCSIRSLAPDWVIPFVAFVDGHPVLRADWNSVISDGQSLLFIDVNAIPQGGGGGGSNPLQAVLMIAVIIYAPYLVNYMGGSGFVAGTAGTFAASGIGAATTIGVTMAGMALISAIIPPPQPTSPQTAAALAAASPTYNLQAQGNTARLEAAIPEHFGRLVAFPDFAAQPYQEYAGNEQYVYQLLCIGRGYYDIEAIRIEDTPIANFDDITYEVVQPGGVLSLFPANVVSSIEVSGQTLAQGSYVGPFVASASGTTANYLGIDFAAPKGLYYANDNGSLSAVSISVQVEAMLIDILGVSLGPWVNLSAGLVYSPWSDWTGVGLAQGMVFGQGGVNTDLVQYSTQSSGMTDENGNIVTTTFMRTRTSTIGDVFSAATTTPQRYSKRYAVAPGRYQVRVTRLDVEQTSTRYGHNIIWAGMRSYLQDNRTFGDVTLLALRMRASNNLSMQSSRKINVICTRKIPVWNGVAWSANTATTSIAWALVYAAKQVGLTDTQIDLPTLLALDATWTARGDSFNARFDSFLSFWEAITKIAGAGRAKPYMQGGVMRFMRDQIQTVPVALFSMRNIVKGSFSVDYLMPTVDTADAVNVGYFDATTWATARVQAKLPASIVAKPVKVDIFGVTSRNQAFREGMYLAATNRYRRKLIKFSTEMEGFIPSFGDLIAIQHDMPAWGQGGEVTAWDAPSLTLTLSEPPTYGTGTHYIGLRKRDGSVDGPYAVTAGAQANQVILASAPSFTPYTDMTEERTHYAFGWAETWRQRARVLSAKPQGLYQVAIECINEDDNVHTAEIGVVTPVMVTSQLSGYTNTPVVTGATAHPMRGNPNTMLIAWPAAAWATSYVIEQSSDGSTWTRSGEATDTSFASTTLYGNASVFRVAAVGFQRGPWCIVPPDRTPPDDVSGLSIDGNKLTWAAVSAMDLDGYRIRYQFGINLDWGTANPLHTGLIPDSPYTMLATPPGLVTIMVKSVDTSGNESVNAAYVIINLGNSLVANVVENCDFKALSWSGTVTNATNVGGNIQATQSDPYYKIDVSNFYLLDGASFYAANYDAMEWISGGYTPSLAAAGSNMTAAWTLAGDAVNVQYRPTGPSQFYAGDMATYYNSDTSAFYSGAGPWLAWPGSIIAKNQEYQWRVTSSVGPTTGLLSAFTVSVDVPDKLKKFNSIAISASGTRITGAIGLFSVIQNIQLTLQGGSTAVLLEIQDYSTTLGPLITAKNSAGTQVPATIDALLQGY